MLDRRQTVRLTEGLQQRVDDLVLFRTQFCGATAVGPDVVVSTEQIAFEVFDATIGANRALLRMMHSRATLRAENQLMTESAYS